MDMLVYRSVNEGHFLKNRPWKQQEKELKTMSITSSHMSSKHQFSGAFAALLVSGRVNFY